MAELNEPIWDKTTEHLKRIQPQMSVDATGRITWMPVFTDYDASLFYRGKTVTNNEFNELFLKDAYHGNYITDSLNEFFNKHLNSAIYRTFTADFNIVPSYTKSFSMTDWGDPHEDGYYYINITAEEHGFMPAETVDEVNRMNIDTEMHLLGHDGRFYEVTQVDVDADNTVRIYTDDNTLSGVIVIRANDKAYTVAAAVIDATQITGLANVAISGKYTDLIGINAEDGPNTRIQNNTNAITSIVSGETEVAKATHAIAADETTRLLTNGYIQGIAIKDIFEEGSSYVKNATNAINAVNATNVENTTKINGLEIKRDERGVLKIGDMIIPQKKSILSGSVNIGALDYVDIITVDNPFKNKTFEILLASGTIVYIVKLRPALPALDYALTGFDFGNTHVQILYSQGQIKGYGKDYNSTTGEYTPSALHVAKVYEIIE